LKLHRKAVVLAWLGILVSLCIYSAIPAWSAQLAAKYLFKFKPEFKRIFLLVLASLLVSIFMNLIISIATSSNSQFKQDSVFIPVASLFLARFILFSKFIKQTEIGVIGESKALKIIVLSTIIEILLAIPLALILVLLFNFMR